MNDDEFLLPLSRAETEVWASTPHLDSAGQQALYQPIYAPSVLSSVLLCNGAGAAPRPGHLGSEALSLCTRGDLSWASRSHQFSHQHKHRNLKCDLSGKSHDEQQGLYLACHLGDNVP